MSELEQQMKKNEYKAYPWRWLVLFAFCTFTFCNCLSFVQYSPILSLAAEYYGVSQNQILWFSNCYYITYFIFSPFTIRPLEKWLDRSLILAAFNTTLGQWFIYVAKENYDFALVGFIFIGMGQIFILGAPACKFTNIKDISDRWFPMHERTISTSLGSFFNLIGLNFSIIYASTTFRDVQVNELEEKINSMNLLFAILTSIALFFCITMIRNKPATPPSASAAAEKMQIYKSFLRVFTTLESFLDLISFSMFIGVSWAYMIVISVLLAPYEYTVEQIGYVSIVYTATGTVSGTLASIYIDYQIKHNSQPKYDLLIKFFLTIAIAAILIKALIINYVNDQVIVALTAIIGFGLNSFLPLCLQSYIEKLYPSFELVLTTAIMQISNLFGFILSYVLILPIFESGGLWVILVSLGPFYLYLMFLYKTKFTRLEMENNVQKSGKRSQLEQEKQPLEQTQSQPQSQPQTATRNISQFS